MQPFVAADANTFGPLIAGMPDPLKRYQEQLAFKVGLDSQQAETMFKTAQVAAAAQKIQRQQQFGVAMQGYLKNPTAEGLGQLLAQFPEYSQESSAAFKALDAKKQTVDLTQMGEVASLAKAGNWDKAAEVMQARVDADKAAGDDDPTDQHILDGLKSGDAARQKEALGLLTFGIGVAVGPEHAGSFLPTVGLTPDLMAVAPGVDVIDKNNTQGGSVYSSPYRPQLWTDPTTGQTFQLVPNGQAGTQGGAPVPASGGFDSAVAFTLGHEGGYNPSDRNGAPVNFGINQKANPGVDVKNLTKDQAKQIYLDKYWKPSGAENLAPAMQTPYFDTYVLNPKKAQQILKAAGGNPMKFIQLRRTWLKGLEKSGKYDEAWTARTDALEQMLHSSGGGYYGDSGTTPTQTATVGGKTYYKVNGQWYDNPEGK